MHFRHNLDSVSHENPSSPLVPLTCLGAGSPVNSTNKIKNKRES